MAAKRGGDNNGVALKYRVIAFFAGLLLFVLPASSAQGQQSAIHYFSANGNDNNSCTVDLPCKTIARVNSLPLNPGDKVLFRRGDTFSGRLIPARSGTDAAWIVYGAYGSGNRPIIDGSASSALYIDGPSVHHLRYEDMDFSGATGANVQTARVYTHDMYFYNCVFRGSANWTGFSAYSNSGADIYNITIDSSTFTGNYKSGVFIGSATGAGGPHNVLIKNSVAYGNGHDVYADHGFYVMFGVLIQNSVAYSNSSAGFKLNCESHADSPYSPVLENNLAYSNNVGIYVGHNRAKIFGNYVHSNTYSNISMDGDGDDNEIYSNIFSNVTNVPGNSSFSFQGGSINTGNIIMNNTFIQDRAVSPRYMFMAARGLLSGFVANNSIDNNTYYTNGNPTTKIFYDGSSFSWNEYRAMSGFPDANGIFLSMPPNLTPTVTPTSAATAAATATRTATPTPTTVPNATATPTSAATATATATRTPTPTTVPSSTATPTSAATAAATATRTPTATPTVKPRRNHHLYLPLMRE